MDNSIPKFEDTSPYPEIPPKFEDTSPYPHELATVSPIKSALMGGLEGGTLGFASSLQGGLQTAGDVLSNPSKLSDMEKLMEEYRAHQQASQQNFDEAKKANPKSYFAGNVAGGLGTALIPGLGELNLGKAAGLGALSGLGYSNDNLIGKDVDTSKLVKDAAIGGALGGTGYKASKLLGSLFSSTDRGDVANTYAAKALGISPKAEYSGSQFTQDEAGNLIKGTLADRSKGIGTTALETGALPLTGGAEASYNAVQSAINDNVGKVTPILQSVNEKLQNVDPDLIEQSVGNISDDISSRIGDMMDSLKGGTVGSKVADKIEENLNPFMERIETAGNDVVALNNIKQDVWKDIKLLNKTAFTQQDLSHKPLLSAYKQVGGMLSDSINKLSNAAEPGAGDAVSKLNQQYGNLQELSSATFNQAGKEMNGSLLDPSLKNIGLGSIGAAGLATGHPIATIAAIGAKGLEAATGNSIGKLGNIALAKGNQALSQGLSKLDFTGTPESVSRALYNAPSSSLFSVVNQLRSSNLTNLADALAQSVQNEDNQKKNATIFAIMQNPEARKALSQ